MSAFRRRILAFALGCVGVGIIFIMIAVGYAKDHKSEYYSDRDETMSDVIEKADSIKLNISNGTVILTTGSEFKISARRILKDQITSKVEDGCWVISDNEDDYVDGPFELFSHLESFSFNGFGMGSDGPEIVITVPREFKAENLILHLGAGELIADELLAKKAELVVGAGLMQIKSMMVDGFTSVETGAGKIDVEYLKSQSARFQCGMGNIDVNAEIPSDIEANCGMGELELDLLGNEKDYNYDIGCGIGEISVNGTTYGSIGKQRINYSADANVSLDCGIGSIKISIEDESEED